MEINPYLTFNGNCREALETYAHLFGGEIIAMQTFGDSPMGAEMPDAAKGLVMHAQLKIGDRVIMASDDPQGGEVKITGFQMQTGFDNVAEAKEAFDALAKGGEVTMPFDKTFWAAGFGMLRDRFGVPWMMNCDQERQPI